ncbi:MAG: hypothetical protein ACJ8J0_23275 [Longimicrobiaceae bacterium]
MKLWEDPTAYVTCWIDWYQEGFGRQAYYDWRLEDYGGIVRNCSFDNPTQIAPGPDAGYDPYDTFDPEESGNCAIGSNGDGAGDNGGGDDGGCPMEYVYVEISYDGGATWVVLWEGWAEVCA